MTPKERDHALLKIRAGLDSLSWDISTLRRPTDTEVAQWARAARHLADDLDELLGDPYA